jgi:hypothetical protein
MAARAMVAYRDAARPRMQRPAAQATSSMLNIEELTRWRVAEPVRTTYIVTWPGTQGSSHLI